MSGAPSGLAVCRLDAGMSMGAAMAAVKRQFRDAGLDTPDLDARLLVCWVTGVDAAKLITNPDARLADHAAALSRAVERRLAREPVARIIGLRDFYGRTFEVTPATLDPRPDSETIIDAVLAYVRANGGVDLPWRVLDVGTGTGCLLVTLLAELPNATGVGTDLSSEALLVAARNAKQNGVAMTRIEFLKSDVLYAVRDKFDLIVSNPPYIPTGDIASLDAEVRLYDPCLALDGGADGLDIYRRIVGDIDTIVSVGYICLEVGFDQAAAVIAMLAEKSVGLGWPPAEVMADLGGNARCVTQKARR